MSYPTSVESRDEERYIEVSAKLTLDDLVDTVERLPIQDLTKFVQRVVAILRARQKDAMPADEEEQTLLQGIEAQLSTEAQAQLNTLREKNRSGKLTPAEHAQLLNFVKQVERQDVARVEALVALAHKRGITVSTLMDILDIRAM